MNTTTKFYILLVSSLLVACTSSAPPKQLSGSEENDWTYNGKYRDGMRHGKGVCYWEDGKRFVGRWKYDEMHGFGKMFYPNGDVYEGEWAEGVKQGRGTYLWARTGASYIGGFANGKKNGYGTLKLPNGEKHAGYWKKDLAEGEGKHTWEDGTVYHGNWKAGKMHGNGLMTYPDRSIVQGEWEEGVYVPCDCGISLPIAQEFEQHDAVFVGRVISIEGIGKKTDEVIFEVTQYWKGKLGFGRRIVLQSGFSSCDLIFFQGESYLIFAEQEGSYLKAKNCNPSGMLDNRQAELIALKALGCQKGAVEIKFGISSYDSVCGCDGITYKNPLEASKAGITYWKAGKCVEKDR